MRLPEPALQELVRGAVLGGHAAGAQSALRLSFPFRFVPPGPSGHVSCLPRGFFSARLSPLRPVGLGKTGCDIRRQQDSLSSWPPGTFPAALCPHPSMPGRPSTTPVDPRHPAFTPGAELAPRGWQVWPPLTCRNKCLSFLLKCYQKTDGGVSFSGCGSFADPQSGWHSVIFL